jgi:putative two-component system response regulator
MLKKILVVDDDDVCRDLLAEILEVEYDIVPAKNGAEALGLLSFQLGKVAAVLLDIMMPQMNGYEFLKVFNEKGWDKKVPVIVVTASDDEETFEKCRELGIKFFIRKPYTLKEASGVIESAIKSFKKKN